MMSSIRSISTQVAILALLLGLSALAVRPALAQEDVVIGFIVQADSVAQASGEEELSSYIHSRAPLVGAAVGTLLEIGFEVGIQGDAGAEDENLQFALRIARIHAESGDSGGPLAYAEHYQGWSTEDRAQKLAAQEYEAQAVEARGEGDYDLALAKLAQAAKIYDTLGDTRALAVLWGSRGVVHYYRNDLESMENVYGRALSLRREIDDRILVGKTLNGLGTVHFLTDRYPEAIDWYTQAVEVRRSTGDLAGLVTSTTYLGNVYYQLGDLVPAEENFAKAEQLLRQLGEGADAQRADLLNSRASVLDEMGDREGAIEAYRAAIEINERLGESGKVAANRCNLAFLLTERGRYAEAMEQLDRAEALLEVDATAEQALGFYKVRQELYHYLGDLEAARDDLLEARKLAAEFEMPVEQIEISLALSRLYFYLGAPDRALKMALEAAQEAQDAEVSRLTRRAWYTAGDAALALGDAESGLQYFENALAIDEASGATVLALQSRLGIAIALAKAERFPEAREIFRELLPQLEETGQDQNTAGAWIGLADTYEEESPDKAREYYGEALAALERMRVEAGDLAATTFFVSETGYLFQEIARYYASQHAANPDGPWAERALEVAESAKSRGLLDRIDGGGAAQFSLAEIQSALPENTLLLQYALGDSASLLWVISAEEVELIELPAKEQLRPQVERLRSALSTPGTGDARLVEGSRALYETLLAPARGRMDAATELIIVPDGALYLLPFELLLEEDPREEDVFSEYAFVGRRYSTSYAPSSTVWLRLSTVTEHSSGSTLLALGNPDFSGLQGVELAALPYSQEEVELVSLRVDSDQRDVFVGVTASETALRSTLSERNPLILHLATHGLVDPAEPDRSCVVLSADEKNDGFLYSGEIQDLEPASALVVLSACETATGRLRRGEGVIGLGRSFLASGSHAVIASLWPVSDESTAVLMDAFYENLLQGNGAAQSLTRARRVLLAAPAYAHPYHWAAFVLVGDPAAPWATR